MGVLTDHQTDLFGFLAKLPPFGVWEFKFVCNLCERGRIIYTANEAEKLILQHAGHFTDLFYRRRGHWITPVGGWVVVGKGFRQYLAR